MIVRPRVHTLQAIQFWPGKIEEVEAFLTGCRGQIIVRGGIKSRVYWKVGQQDVTLESGMWFVRYGTNVQVMNEGDFRDIYEQKPDGIFSLLYDQQHQSLIKIKDNSIVVTVDGEEREFFDALDTSFLDFLNSGRPAKSESGEFQAGWEAAVRSLKAHLNANFPTSDDQVINVLDSDGSISRVL